MVAAAVDTNDDGTFIEFVVLHRDDDGAWREVTSGGSGLLSSGWAYDHTWMIGRTDDDQVTVTLAGEAHHVAVEPSGYWAAIFPSAPHAKVTVSYQAW